MKELNCLYSINEIFTVPGTTESEVFNELINIIPLVWQYPEITTVRIQLNDTVYQSANFRKTEWMMKDGIFLDRTQIGLMEISYLEKKKELFSDPFLEEEIILFKNIIQTIEKFLLRELREDELIVAKENAEKADRLKSSFLMNMSHEIRTPMNAVIGFSNLLLNPEISKKEQNEFLEIILGNGDRLLHLIDDILDVSKIESGLMEISETEFSLSHLLTEMVMIYDNKRINMEKQNLKIRISQKVIKQDYILMTDPVRLKQVLSNLIHNALKFTESGFVEIGYSIQSAAQLTKNHVKTNEDGQLIKIYVKDTGIGIPEDHIESIFDRFIKVEGNTKLYEGTGLGLTISKNLVELLGGKIWVESVVDQGSTFYFTLPIKVSDNESKDIKLKDKIPDKFEWTDKVILIAEDEESNYSLLEHILKETKVQLLWAKNGIEAIDICRSYKNINLVLMDIKMPEMDGYAATKSIKKIRKDIPVIAVTAYAEDKEKEESSKAGCDDYMAKPIEIDNLLPLIDKYMEG